MARSDSNRARIYTLSWVDEFVPFAVLFTLWFDDRGVSIAQLSLVFIMWSAAALVLEVPTGVLADRVDRRRLLAIAFVIRAVGLAVWLIWPTVAGLLIGAALWAIHDALASGAWEALIHDQLAANDEAAEYGVVIARVSQFSHLGLAAAALAATGLLALGASLEALGWVSVVLHIVSIALVLSLPDVRWVVRTARIAAEDDAGTSGGLSAFRKAAKDRTVIVIVMVGALVGGLAVIDEYVPLLARQRGVSDAIVPLAFLMVWLGLVIGGELAARHPAMPARTISAFLTIGAACATVALLVDSLFALPLIGLTYAAIEATWIISDVRLQLRVPAHIRATVTSVREFLVGVVAVIAFAAIGALTRGSDPTAGLVAVSIVLIGVGLFAAALPDR